MRFGFCHIRSTYVRFTRLARTKRSCGRPCPISKRTSNYRHPPLLQQLVRRPPRYDVYLPYAVAGRAFRRVSDQSEPPTSGSYWPRPRSQVTCGWTVARHIGFSLAPTPGMVDISSIQPAQALRELWRAAESPWRPAQPSSRAASGAGPRGGRADARSPTSGRSRWQPFTMILWFACRNLGSTIWHSQRMSIFDARDTAIDLRKRISSGSCTFGLRPRERRFRRSTSSLPSGVARRDRRGRRFLRRPDHRPDVPGRRDGWWVEHADRPAPVRGRVRQVKNARRR
jgi:hypothetical protein